MSVRFVDPKTKRVVYPEPFQEHLNAVTPGLETNTPSVGALVVNPLLAPANPLLASIKWDIRLPFDTYVEQWPQAERAKLAQSATLPPAVLLELQSPHLPWKIEVRPRTPVLHITVFDVLATIHAALEARIAPGEWDQFDTVGKRVIVAARGLRVQEYDPARQADEMYNHPRRIDSLGEFTRFAGLVPAPQRGLNSLDLKLKRRR